MAFGCAQMQEPRKCRDQRIERSEVATQEATYERGIAESIIDDADTGHGGIQMHGDGNGNASLAAARRFAEVTSTDYVPALLERGRVRADAEGLTVAFKVADAEALPFADASFDVVLSTFGVMFTPDHTRAAREMLRVTREGGRIGLANWTPESFIGQLFKTVGAYLPPPAGVTPPARWGTEPHIVSLFGSQDTDIQCTRRHFNFRYRSNASWIQIFRDFYGPVFKSFAALDAPRQAALERHITDLLERFNTGGKDSLVVPSEYLEVIVVKR